MLAHIQTGRAVAHCSPNRIYFWRRGCFFRRFRADISRALAEVSRNAAAMRADIRNDLGIDGSFLVIQQRRRSTRRSVGSLPPWHGRVAVICVAICAGRNVAELRHPACRRLWLWSSASWSQRVYPERSSCAMDYDWHLRRRQSRQRAPEVRRRHPVFRLQKFR